MLNKKGVSLLIVCAVVIGGCFGGHESKQEATPATTSTTPSKKQATPSVKETPKEQPVKKDDGPLTWSKLLKDRPKEMQTKQEALKTAMKSLKK